MAPHRSSVLTSPATTTSSGSWNLDFASASTSPSSLVFFLAYPRVATWAAFHLLTPPTSPSYVQFLDPFSPVSSAAFQSQAFPVSGSLNITLLTLQPCGNGRTDKCTGGGREAMMPSETRAGRRCLHTCTHTKHMLPVVSSERLGKPVRVEAKETWRKGAH